MLFLALIIYIYFFFFFFFFFSPPFFFNVIFFTRASHSSYISSDGFLCAKSYGGKNGGRKQNVHTRILLEHFELPQSSCGVGDCNHFTQPEITLVQ